MRKVVEASKLKRGDWGYLARVRESVDRRPSIVRSSKVVLDMSTSRGQNDEPVCGSNTAKPTEQNRTQLSTALSLIAETRGHL